jgi:hypothetical protein
MIESPPKIAIKVSPSFITMLPPRRLFRGNNANNVLPFAAPRAFGYIAPRKFFNIQIA